MDINYYNKYCKYKQKYIEEKKRQDDLFGGDIEQNDVLRLIESIGYEFESADILVFFDQNYVNTSDDYYLNDLSYYKDELHDIDYSNKELMSKSYKIVNLYDEDNTNYKLSVQLDPDSLAYDAKDITPIYKIIKNIEKEIDEEESPASNNSILLKVDDSSNSYIRLSNEIRGDWDGFSISHCEYLFTFTNLKKSNNVIKKTMNICISFLNEHFTKADTIPIFFTIKDGSTSMIGYPDNILLYRSEQMYNVNDVNTPISYLVASKEKQELTYKNAKWNPQMTFGVKLENLHHVYIYMSNSYKSLKIILKGINHERKILISKFKRYLEINKLEIQETIINKIGGYIFLVNYNTNIAIQLFNRFYDKFKDQDSHININDHSHYPFVIRHSEKKLCNYMNIKYGTYINYFCDFIRDLIDDKKLQDDEDIKKLHKKYNDLNEKIQILEHKNREDRERIRLLIKIKNSTNLFSHLLVLQKNYIEKFDSRLDYSDYNLTGPTLKKDYDINDDIILTEDRFFIKDLTKIFDTQHKLTLDELTKIVL